jgi:gliding-associated putative ABC transporter substrate-binding component GldG
MPKLSFKGFVNWWVFAGITASLVLVNIIFSLLNYKIDLTEDQRFSLSEGTKKFLSEKENIQNRISIKVYLDGDLPAEIKNFRNSIENKLKDFKDLAGDRIEYEFVSIDQGNESEKDKLEFEKSIFDKGILPTTIVYRNNSEQVKMRIWAGAEMTTSVNGEIKSTTVQLLPGSTNRNPFDLKNISPYVENATNNLEYNLLSGIRKLGQKQQKRIAFLQGHGELKEAETFILRSLLSPYFSLSSLTLKTKESYQELANLDGIIIADPQRPFSEVDLYFIDQFVMNGGSLMVFMNTLKHNEDTLTKNWIEHTTRKNLQLDKMLFDYGVKVHENYVFDRVCSGNYFNRIGAIPWPYFVMASPTKHQITANIDPVSLEYPNQLQLIDVPNVRSTSILTTSSNANRTGIAPQIACEDFKMFGSDPQFIENPNDPVNKITVAAMIEGTIPSFFVNRTLVDTVKGANITESSSMKQVPKKFQTKKAISSSNAKIFVVGSGRCIANPYDSVYVNGQIKYRPTFNTLKFSKIPDANGRPLIFGNQEFVQNMVDYLMADNSLLGLRSRQIEFRRLDSSKVTQHGSNIKYLNLLVPAGLIFLFGTLMIFYRYNTYARKK